MLPTSWNMKPHSSDGSSVSAGATSTVEPHRVAGDALGVSSGLEPAQLERGCDRRERLAVGLVRQLVPCAPSLDQPAEGDGVLGRRLVGDVRPERPLEGRDPDEAVEKREQLERVEGLVDEGGRAGADGLLARVRAAADRDDRQPLREPGSREAGRSRRGRRFPAARCRGRSRRARVRAGSCPPRSRDGPRRPRSLRARAPSARSRRARDRRR